MSGDLRDDSTSSCIIIIVSSTELVTCGFKSGSTALLSSKKGLTSKEIIQNTSLFMIIIVNTAINFKRWDSG